MNHKIYKTAASENLHLSIYKKLKAYKFTTASL